MSERSVSDKGASKVKTDSSTRDLLEKKESDEFFSLMQGLTSSADALATNLLEDFTRDVKDLSVPPFSSEELKDNFSFETAKDFETFRNELAIPNIVFAKSISSLGLTVISLRSRLIAFHDQSTHRVHIDNLAFDYVACMDFEIANSLFIFAFSCGKVQFGRWENGKLRWIEKPVDAFKQSPYEVKMIHGSWLILGSVRNGSDELITRVNSKQIQYNPINLRLSKMMMGTIEGLSTVTLRNKSVVETRPFNPKSISDRNWVVISVNGSSDVCFYTFLLLTNKAQFDSFDESSFRMIFQARNPNESKSFIALQAKARESSPSLEEESKKSQISAFVAKTIVLFGKNLWIRANYEFVLIIWGNVLQQYFINPDMTFGESFTLSLPYNVIHAFIGATELLVVLTESFEIRTIDISKLRNAQTILQPKKGFDDLKGKFSSDSEFVVASDFCSCSVGFFASNNLQSFKISSWETYLKNFKSKNENDKTLLLARIISHQAFPLNGAILPNSPVSSHVDFEITQSSEFNEKLGAIVSETISHTLNALENSEKLDDSIELYIWMLIKTNNFELLFDRLLEVILNKSTTKDGKPTGRVFIERLAKEMTESMLEQPMAIFFAQIDRFQGIDETLIKFFFFIAQKFVFSETVFGLLKMAAQKKNFVLFLFYLLLLKPTDSQTLADLSDIIKTDPLKIVISQRSPAKDVNCLLLGFCFVFDVFTSQKLFKISPALISKIQNVEEVASIQSYIAQWFFSQGLNLFIKKDPMKSLFCLCNIYKALDSSRSSGNFGDLDSERSPKASSFEETLIENCRPEFDHFFMNLISQGTCYESYFLLLAFVYKHPDMVVQIRMVPTIFNRMIHPSFLEEWKSNQTIDPNLFLLVFFEFYYNVRKVLIDFSYDQVIDAMPEKNEVFKFIANDLRNNVEANFEIISAKPIFFSIFEIALRDLESMYGKKYIEMIKIHCLSILKKDEEKFLNLISNLPVSDIDEIAKKLSTEKKSQFNLISRITEARGPNVFSRETILQYLALICEFEPTKIIDFLELFSYNAQEAMKICKKLNQQRGVGYLSYKIGDTSQAIEIYKELIVTTWSKEELSKSQEAELKTVFEELIHFQTQEKADFKLYLELILFCNDLSGRSELKNEILGALFSKLFSLNCGDLLVKLKDLKLFNVFLKDTRLIIILLMNYRNQVELNSSISQIYSEEMLRALKILQEKCIQPAFLHKRPCSRCQQFDFSSFNPIFQHVCGYTFHLTCEDLTDANGMVCPDCGLLISFNQDNEQSFARRSSARMDRSISSFGMTPIDPFMEARIFETSIAVNYELAVEDFNRKFDCKRGFKFLDVNAVHFNV